MAVEIMPPTKYKALAVSVSEAGRILGVSRPTIYALIADGDLKIKKAKGRTLIPMWSLEAFIGAPGE